MTLRYIMLTNFDGGPIRDIGIKWLLCCHVIFFIFLISLCPGKTKM